MNYLIEIMQEFLREALSLVPTSLKIISAIAGVVLMTLKIGTLLKKNAHEVADLQRQIDLKELEIEALKRTQTRDRERYFRELGGYVVRREGIINGNGERFTSYDDQKRMNDFDADQSGQMDILITELRHLLTRQGNTSLIYGTRPQHKTFIQRLIFWKK